MIQRWWKLLQHRRRKTTSFRAALQVYFQVEVHRVTRFRTQKLQFTPFERQIKQFQIRSNRELQTTKRKLKPAFNTDNLVFSTQTMRLFFLTKSIHSHCQQIWRDYLQMRVYLSLELPSPSVSNSAMSFLAVPGSGLAGIRKRRSSGQLMIAKNLAVKNLMIRRCSVSSRNSSSGQRDSDY